MADLTAADLDSTASQTYSTTIIGTIVIDLYISCNGQMPVIFTKIYNTTVTACLIVSDLTAGNGTGTKSNAAAAGGSIIFDHSALHVKGASYCAAYSGSIVAGDFPFIQGYSPISSAASIAAGPVAM